jgi:hypothetical protein
MRGRWARRGDFNVWYPSTLVTCNRNCQVDIVVMITAQLESCDDMSKLKFPRLCGEIITSICAGALETG